MSDEHLTKSEKKKALNKKNRYHQEIFGLLRFRREDAERVKGLEEAKKPKRSEAKDDEVWSAKVATIRNRLNDQRRESKERWNRFAGTEGGGGRGL